MNDADIRARALLLAEQRLANRPGAIERFREFLASAEGNRALDSALRGVRQIKSLIGEFVGPGSFDEPLLAFVDQWAAATATPDDVQPLPALSATAAPRVTANPSDADSRRWTPERLQALAECRAERGTQATAQEFGISASRVRELLRRRTETTGPSADNPFPRRR